MNALTITVVHRIELSADTLALLVKLFRAPAAFAEPSHNLAGLRAAPQAQQPAERIDPVPVVEPPAPAPEPEAVPVPPVPPVRKPHKWTAEEDALVLSPLSKTVTMRSIAEQIGLPKQLCHVRKYDLQKRGVTSAPPAPEPPPPASRPAANAPAVKPQIVPPVVVTSAADDELVRDGYVWATYSMINEWCSRFRMKFDGTNIALVNKLRDQCKRLPFTCVSQDDLNRALAQRRAA